MDDNGLRKAIWIAFQLKATTPVGVRYATTATQTNLNRYRDMRDRYFSFRKQAEIGSCGPTAMSYCAQRLGLSSLTEGVASAMIASAQAPKFRNKRAAIAKDYSNSGSFFTNLLAAINSTDHMTCELRTDWRMNPAFPTIFRMDWVGAGNNGHFAVAMDLVRHPQVQRRLFVVFDPWYGLQYLAPEASKYLTHTGALGVIDQSGIVVSRDSGTSSGTHT
ncbi:MAG: hypothetical protein KDA89_19855 [Planctomycetaceae bacterium]|nr:hypothetical protein [Planctomycetaceae bacterium]